MHNSIAAIATAHGVSSISIIRVSGDAALEIAHKISHLENITPRHAHLTSLYNFKNELIDHAIMIYFAAPHSFTGEEIVEFQCHGGMIVAQEILDTITAYGVRLAEPGEFSKRAFLNGKIDLTEAEAISKLIEAKSVDAAKILAKQMKGELKTFVDESRDALLKSLAYSEVMIDYAEEDIPDDIMKSISTQLDGLTEQIEKIVDASHRRRGLIEGFKVAIIGKPNVGKSSLLNALLSYDRAIVSDIAGTTRDTIEEVINIEGVQFRFIDTAGLRDTSNKIEIIGIQKALERAEKAKVIIYLLDATADFKAQEKEIKKIKKLQNKMIVVVNKTDLNPNICKTLKKKNYLFISAKNKDGIEDLTKTLISIIDTNLSSDETIISNSRHQEELSKTLVEIIALIEGLNNYISGDLLAINIRQALYHLGLITGEVTTDDLLGNIFSKFCIGK